MLYFLFPQKKVKCQTQTTKQICDVHGDNVHGINLLRLIDLRGEISLGI